MSTPTHEYTGLACAIESAFTYTKRKEIFRRNKGRGIHLEKTRTAKSRKNHK